MAEFEKDFRSKSNLSGKREIRLPLVLTGHGISLRIESGALHVRDGLTHYPQVRQEYRFFPGKHNTPSRIVLLGQNGSVSLDALCWLSAQCIPLVVLDYRGNELSSVCAAKQEADYEVRIAQLIATRPEHAIEIARSLIRAKLAGSLGNLELWPESQPRFYAEHKLTAYLESIESADTNNDLLVLEAAAAQTYFKAWQQIPLSWTSKSERFLPDEWSAFSNRESRVSGRNRNASHPVNAILNYAYGVLESQVRIACAMLGLDTSIAYLHAMKHRRESLIFDLAEPLRPRLERRFISFFRSAVLSEMDFAINLQGCCALNPQLSRRVVAESLSDQEVQQSVTSFRDRLLSV